MKRSPDGKRKISLKHFTGVGKHERYISKVTTFLYTIKKPQPTAPTSITKFLRQNTKDMLCPRDTQFMLEEEVFIFKSKMT